MRANNKMNSNSETIIVVAIAVRWKYIFISERNTRKISCVERIIWDQGIDGW